MLLCMRTTFDLNDALYYQVKEAALRTGRAMKDVVEDSLRLAFKQPEGKPTSRITLPESKAAPGVRPGVDLHNSAALIDLMESPNATA